MENRNIILIGMSGAGKSTLGVLLAKALGMSFLDTDILIQQHEGRKLQDIIDRDGVEQFLQIEEAIVSKVQAEHTVIATGGSVVYSERIMTSLKENGTVVFLTLPYEELVKRLKNITTRGIVIKKGNSLQDVYEERLPLYQKYADFTVNCTGKDVERCVEELAALF